MSNPVEYMQSKPDNNFVENSDEKLDQTEINCESLAILASLGSTKEYLGEELSLGDIKKLKEADVLKSKNIYLQLRLMKSQKRSQPQQKQQPIKSKTLERLQQVRNWLTKTK